MPSNQMTALWPESICAVDRVHVARISPESNSTVTAVGTGCFRFQISQAICCSLMLGRFIWGCISLGFGVNCSGVNHSAPESAEGHFS